MAAVTVVLDTWAVIRLLRSDHPAGAEVAALLEVERPVMSWVNVGEVAYVMQRQEGAALAEEAVRDLGEDVELELPDAARILEAARIKADHAMSYADAFAAATAVAHRAELWTGDPELLVEGAPWAWRDLRA